MSQEFLPKILKEKAREVAAMKAPTFARDLPLV